MEITWQQYHGYVEELDDQITSLIPVGSIGLVGIPRGGLMLALHLTYLDSRYEILDSDVCDERNSVVVIDDVLETGKTREKWVKIVADCFRPKTIIFVVIVDKSACYGIPSADIGILSMDKKEWVTFPYERRGNVKEVESMKVRGY